MFKNYDLSSCAFTCALLSFEQATPRKSELAWVPYPKFPILSLRVGRMPLPCLLVCLYLCTSERSPPKPRMRRAASCCSPGTWTAFIEILRGPLLGPHC